MNFNKLLFPWKPVDVQLGTISENAHIGDCYRCAKFHACIKKFHNLPEISSYAAGLVLILVNIYRRKTKDCFCCVLFKVVADKLNWISSFVDQPKPASK